MMMPSKSSYRRLPGRSERTFHWVRPDVSSRLWLADDHILNVRKSQYSSSYRRYYLNDIQALSMTRTTRRAVVNVVLALVLAAIGTGFFLFANATGEQGTMEFQVVLVLCALPWLILMLFNTLRGPACVCCLHTAVQRDELPSLCRVKKAQRVYALLKPLIDDAQGTVTSAQLEAEENGEAVAAEDMR